MNEPESHFLPSELACKHCGKGTLNPDTLRRLEIARTYADTPMKVNSGFRCPEHNLELVRVGKGEPNSAHLNGRAVDIAVHNSRERYLFLEAFIEAGFVRIGIGKTFIHVDDDETKPQNCVWVY
jgi:uncharacterized protein YcbK (DUF882 family)